MSWSESEDAAEARERIAREIAKRKSRGEVFEPLVVPGGSKAIARTFWGKAWCRHLQTYSAYEHRLPSGRSYLRQGNVYNLQIEPGLVSAEVSCSSMHSVQITVDLLSQEDWGGLKDQCAGRVASLLDLLEGRLDGSVMEVMCNPEHGIFPAPAEIRMSCSCPDWADMCRHVAAVMYGIGVRFDSDAALFFRLRGVDPSELLAGGARNALAAVPPAEESLAGMDLGALFGIDLAPVSEGEPECIQHPPKDPATGAYAGPEASGIGQGRD